MLSTETFSIVVYNLSRVKIYLRRESSKRSTRQRVTFNVAFLIFTIPYHCLQIGIKE